MTSAQNPEPEDRKADTFGGPDPGDREDELAGPGAVPGPDTFGGPDPSSREDELAGPGGTAGPDTFGGPDEGEEDELRPDGRSLPA
jgi:hypothetical protein